MALGNVYTNGTITIGTDKLTVTGVGTLWTPQVEVGDWILCNGQVGMIAIVNGDTIMTLQSQWQGTLPSAATYVLMKMSWLRYDPALTQAKLRELLADLDAQGNFLFVDTVPPQPENAMGDDGQWALQTNVSPWRLWYKTGGVWVEQAAPAGLKWRGAWTTATSYAAADAVQSGGSSYVCILGHTSGAGNAPPNATYWNLMAAQGATGSTGSTGPQGMVWRGNWNSSTAYVVNDGVANAGNSYICVTAHAATATPPPTANWNLIAQGGTTTIADSQIDPIKLNSDNSTEQLLFRDRLNFVTRDPSGDVMNGILTFNRPNTTNFNAIVGQTNAKNRWRIIPGSNESEGGANAGSNFYLQAFDDTGVTPITALTVNRATGLATVIADPVAPLGIATMQYAAPMDAFAFSGMQVNGAMEVSQQLGNTPLALVGGNSLYCLDQWQAHFVHAGSAAFTAGQGTPGIPGLKNSLVLTATTGGNLGAANGDLARIVQYVEGYRIARLGMGAAGAVPFTIGFYIFATISGTASVTVLNSDQSRYYTTTVPVTAGTWTYQTVTIPADTAGTWFADNRLGLAVNICSLCGLTFQGTAGSWTAGATKLCTAGTTNFFASNNNVLAIAGFGLWPGNSAPAAAKVPFVMRSADTELTLCRRYWRKSYDYATKPGTASNFNGALQLGVQGLATGSYLPFAQHPFGVPMRAVPNSVTVYSPSTGAANVIFNNAVAADVAATVSTIGDSGFVWFPSTNLASFAGYNILAHYVANARL